MARKIQNARILSTKKLLLTLIAVVHVQAAAWAGAEESSAADAIVEQIDSVVVELDEVLNKHLVEYLESIGLRSSDLSSIERNLKKVVKQERAANYESYNEITEQLHLIEVKIRFLRAEHSEFSGLRLPTGVASLFSRLAELEKQLSKLEASEVP